LFTLAGYMQSDTQNVSGLLSFLQERPSVGDAERVTPPSPYAGRPDPEQIGHAQTMEALGRITGGIAHELNNMLLAINLNLEALADEISPSETTQPMFDGAQQAVEQARDVTAQLLAFARRQPLDAGDFDLNHAVTEARALIRLVLPANVEFVPQLDPGAGTVRADRAQFEMALINIALNAGDAMPHGGRLAIATSPADAAGNVMVTIKDTGHGMNPAVAARAFEPFFTTRSDSGRNGLGLSQVYGYIRQSGGRATIESGPAGTTVRLWLPAGRATPMTQQTDMAAQTSRGETIPVVEDAPLVRHAVGCMLSDFG
jgi:signal transduction histidine kinase